MSALQKCSMYFNSEDILSNTFHLFDFIKIQATIKYHI